MDNHTTNSTMNEYLNPLDLKVASKMIDEMKLDSYTKKLDSLSFTKLHIYAQVKQVESQKDLSLELKHKRKVQKMVGLESISHSQLSRKGRNIDPAFFEALLGHLVQQLHRELGHQKANQKLGKIHLIDSSTLSFCLSRYEWADFRSTKAGVKLHQRVVFCGEDTTYPDKLILTPARPADHTQLDNLIVDEVGALHVFDRGYFDFKKYDEYCAKGIRFCTRLKDNTVITVIEEVPVDPTSSVLREAIVKIGKMKHPLRLIETEDTQGKRISIIMNDAKMSAQEISDLYRHRWKIELFFKWVKQNLKIKTTYGKSQNAVFNQIYIAIITFCLSLLLKHRIQTKESLLDVQKYLRIYIGRPFGEFLEVLKPPLQTTKGRQKWDYELEFQMILADYERYKGDIVFDNERYEDILI